MTVEQATDTASASTVQSGRRAGPLRSWGQLIATRGSAVHGLGDNRVGIGREGDVEVRLDDPEVSRHHAVIHRKAGTHWVKDAGSTNGTWHNQQQVDGSPVQLHPGDALRFGPATFTFRVL